MKSYLNYLNDYDLILYLNQNIPLLVKQIIKQYHINRYENRKMYNLLFNNKLNIDKTFIYIENIRNTNKNLSFIPPIYPFYYSENKKIFIVKNAINIYEKYNKFSSTANGKRWLRRYEEDVSV